MCRAVLILSDISLPNCAQRKPEVAHSGKPPKWKFKPLGPLWNASPCINYNCKHVWSGRLGWFSLPGRSFPLTLTSHGIIVGGTFTNKKNIEAQRSSQKDPKRNKKQRITTWWFRPTWFKVVNLTGDKTSATSIIWKPQPSHRSPECHLDAPRFSKACSGHTIRNLPYPVYPPYEQNSDTPGFNVDVWEGHPTSTIGVREKHPPKGHLLGNSQRITRLQGIEPLKNVPIHLVKGRLTKGHRFGKKKLGRIVACDMPESIRKNTRSLTIRRKTWGMPLTSADFSLFGGKRWKKIVEGIGRSNPRPFSSKWTTHVQYLSWLHY